MIHSVGHPKHDRIMTALPWLSSVLSFNDPGEKQSTGSSCFQLTATGARKNSVRLPSGGERPATTPGSGSRDPTTRLQTAISGRRNATTPSLSTVRGSDEMRNDSCGIDSHWGHFLLGLLSIDFRNETLKRLCSTYTSPSRLITGHVTFGYLWGKTVWCRALFFPLDLYGAVNVAAVWDESKVCKLWLEAWPFPRSDTLLAKWTWRRI